MSCPANEFKEVPVVDMNQSNKEIIGQWKVCLKFKVLVQNVLAALRVLAEVSFTTSFRCVATGAAILCCSTDFNILELHNRYNIISTILLHRRH
jgi:hypothetical protein